MIKDQKFYIVTAYRFGGRSNHSYTLGIFSKRDKAKKCANSHYEYRGHKYSCEVEEYVVNNKFDNKNHSSKQIYQSGGFEWQH